MDAIELVALVGQPADIELVLSSPYITIERFAHLFALVCTSGRATVPAMDAFLVHSEFITFDAIYPGLAMALYCNHPNIIRYVHSRMDDDDTKDRLVNALLLYSVLNERDDHVIMLIPYITRKTLNTTRAITDPAYLKCSAWQVFMAHSRPPRKPRL